MTKNLPPHHQWVETEDGSFTLFSEAFQEACHSSSGAKAETLLHYIQGTQVLEKIKNAEQLQILEVGFGLGIGFLTTFEVLQDQPTPWSFLSLEIDEKLLEWFRIEHQEHQFLKHLEWKEENGLKYLRADHQQIQLTILCGNARETLPQYLQAHPHFFHAIYQDAFSPKKNPILWTTQWFSLLKQFSHPSVLLSTYSASTSIRKSLHAAGWSLHKGEKFGPKRTSTRASLEGQSDAEILLHLQRSPAPALSDDNLDFFLTK